MNVLRIMVVWKVTHPLHLHLPSKSSIIVVNNLMSLWYDLLSLFTLYLCCHLSPVLIQECLNKAHTSLLNIYEGFPGLIHIVTSSPSIITVDSNWSVSCYFKCNLHSREDARVKTTGHHPIKHLFLMRTCWTCRNDFKVSWTICTTVKS